jgi:predicted DNA-binding antitoxin AbrB/MazE fold protein
MNLTVEATYENGILKLTEPLPLKEHQKVQVTVRASSSVAEESHGIMGWAGSRERADYFAMDPELDFPTSEEES